MASLDNCNYERRFCILKLLTLPYKTDCVVEVSSISVLTSLDSHYSCYTLLDILDYHIDLDYYFLITSCSKMDTATVHRKLLSGELRIKPVTKKSEVWGRFGMVSDLKGVEQDFVACKTCSCVLSYKKNTSGTSSMKKHKCGVLGKGQPTLIGAAVKHQRPVPVPELPQASRTRITAACVDFCAEDLRPFDTVAGKGLQHLIDVVGGFEVNLGIDLIASMCK